ncbi:hypothetical protein [Streptomyces sp. NBC_00459]|uniref:hypothetical protein n=1 Tax=Streptomyces sp. NBC_00459 TaxID=2975749 RepID=UPI002E17831D
MSAARSAGTPAGGRTGRDTDRRAGAPERTGIHTGTLAAPVGSGPAHRRNDDPHTEGAR